MSEVVKMRVQLDRKEFEYLTGEDFLPSKYKEVIAKAVPNERQFYVLDLSEDDADQIRNYCSDHLVQVGFINDEPTEAGLVLESLIDKFFTG